MTTYSTTYSNGHTRSDTCALTAYNFICYDAVQQFHIDGRRVTPDFFYAECAAVNWPADNGNFDEDTRHFHE